MNVCFFEIYLYYLFASKTSNLQHVSENTRITHEGLMITLQTPNLNKQQQHRSMALVCECVKSIFTQSSQFVDNSGL